MIRRFNRFELKYVIDAETAAALEPEIRARTRVDPEGGPSGRYRVTSLYYDTWDLACYRAKIDGINFRRKLRIRRYGEFDPSKKVMVEIKQRINRTTQKRRLSLPLDAALALCDDGELPPLGNPLDRATAEEVAYLVGALQLRPKCLVKYRRTAFLGGRFEPGLRITFDEDLVVADPRRGLADGAPELVVLPRDRRVLEVKANDLVPLWVSRLLAHHGCRIARYSKYCSGIARLRAERWLSAELHDG